MKRYLAIKLILKNGEGFENLMLLLSTLKTETEYVDNGFIVYIDDDEIIPKELFIYKDCFDLVDGCIRLWIDDKNVNVSNYMDMRWELMKNECPTNGQYRVIAKAVY